MVSSAQLASSFERLVVDASNGPPRGLSSVAPFRTDAVLAARSELTALATTLRCTSRPSPGGVASARRLLTDPASPLYTDDGRDLRVLVRVIAGAVDEEDG